MANPRRTSYSNQLPITQPIPQFQSHTPQTATTILASLKFFLKKLHAFPFLLTIFLLLTWVSLRIQHRSASPLHQSSYAGNGVTVNEKIGGYFKDSGANIVKFSSFFSIVTKDKRGWLINPVSLALHAAVKNQDFNCARDGGNELTCKSAPDFEVCSGKVNFNGSFSDWSFRQSHRWLSGIYWNLRNHKSFCFHQWNLEQRYCLL